MMPWLNLFPDELQLGDVWGERGELRFIHLDDEGMYVMVFCVHGEGWCCLRGGPLALAPEGAECSHCEYGWPPDAPIRVLRVDG